MTQTVFLSSEVSNIYATNCIDPFQVNDVECPLVSKVHGSVFGYDYERNECREVKNTLVCDSQKHVLFNVIHPALTERHLKTAQNALKRSMESQM
jgi:hypothetical protein